METKRKRNEVAITIRSRFSAAFLMALLHAYLSEMKYRVFRIIGICTWKTLSDPPAHFNFIKNLSFILRIIYVTFLKFDISHHTFLYGILGKYTLLLR